jgi:hypothetical protein
MKNLIEFLNECLDPNLNNLINSEEPLCNEDEDVLNEAAESIKDEDDFRDYAENKFQEVFGDDLDEDKMNKTIDGILKDYADDVEKGDWGKLVGVLNKSFGK